MKQYSLSDIQSLRERQQAAHRGRSIYTDKRSISEEQFRNALEINAMPIIEQLLEVVRRQHKTLKEAHEEGYQVDEALAIGEPWIETHQARLNKRQNNEQRSR